MVQSIEAFCQRVQQGLAEATFEQKRQLIELLIDRVIVTNEEVEIRYVIPTSSRSEHVRFCHLLLDYFDQPPMPIPVSTLPCVFERRRGDRGKPYPFQPLLGISRLLFPDANDPHGQGLLAHSRRVRVGARASSDHRKAGAGSNTPGDHAWLEPRRDDSPGWERLVRAEAQT
jgi:hypothetical protein